MMLHIESRMVHNLLVFIPPAELRLNYIRAVTKIAASLCSSKHTTFLHAPCQYVVSKIAVFI